jgi:hypothetical protein
MSKPKKDWNSKQYINYCNQPISMDTYIDVVRGIDLAKIDTKTIFGGKKNFIRRC